jgi:transposase
MGGLRFYNSETAISLAMCATGRQETTRSMLVRQPAGVRRDFMVGRDQDDRRVVEGIIYRYRCGIAWRDLPSEFGPWQTIWQRHRRYSVDGTSGGRRIIAVIPQPSDQIGHRKRRGSTGGRPPAFDKPWTKRTTKAATSSNATSTPSSNGESWQLATTNSPSPTAAEQSSEQSASG